MSSFEKIYEPLKACRNNCYLDICMTTNGYSIVFIDTKKVHAKHPSIELGKEQLNGFFKGIKGVNWSVFETNPIPEKPDATKIINNGDFRTDRLENLFEQYRNKTPHYRIAFHYDVSEKHLRFNHAVFDRKMSKKEIEDLLRKIQKEMRKKKGSNIAFNSS